MAGTSPTRTAQTPASSKTELEALGGRAAQQRGAAALGRALEPVGAQAFFADYWERRPLLVSRDEPHRFDDLLSPETVEELVCSTAIRTPGFRLVKEGAKLDAADYAEEIAWRPSPFTGVARVDRVVAEWEAGATIVLQGLHYTWPPLAEFCRVLEGVFGHPVQANSYYTPRSAQGLDVHHDTHDVLVLQISGHKRWVVYDPALELPLKDQRYTPSLGEPGEPVLDTTLRAGDTLYLPRGWLHKALTSDADSLHVTVGINVYTWLDAVRAALETCADDVEFRRSVEPGAQPPASLLERLEERLGSEDVTARMRARFLGGRRPLRGGQLAQLRALEALGTGTQLERRSTVLSTLDRREGRVVLVFEGKRISFPEHIGAELEAITEADGPFRLADLPGELDDAGRIVLARRLVREGFLVLSDARAPGMSASRNGGPSSP